MWRRFWMRTGRDNALAPATTYIIGSHPRSLRAKSRSGERCTGVSRLRSKRTELLFPNQKGRPVGALFLQPSKADYFFSVRPPKRLLKRATWPPVSIWRLPPVQAGCDLGSMSSASVSPSLPQVERERRTVGHLDGDHVVVGVGIGLHGVTLRMCRFRPAVDAANSEGAPLAGSARLGKG